MKLCYFFLIFLVIIGCTEPTIINEEDPVVESKSPTITRRTVSRAGVVRIYFQFTRDYPAGSVRPDVVKTNQNEIVSEGVAFPKSKQTFVIEKKGYEPLIREVEVKDENGDGKFILTGKLIAKDRVIRFDISDEETEQVITPDRVSVASVGQGSGEMKEISDFAHLKPGRKVVVVQKKGYKSFSQEIDIQPEEEPYFLKCKLTRDK